MAWKHSQIKIFLFETFTLKGAYCIRYQALSKSTILLQSDFRERERQRERGEKINKKKLMGWSVQQKTVTEVLKKLLSACRF